MSPVGVRASEGRLCGPAPAEAGRPMEAEEGDRELVGVRLLVGKLGGPGGAWCGEAEAECLSRSSIEEMEGFSSTLFEVGGIPIGALVRIPFWCCCIRA